MSVARSSMPAGLRLELYAGERLHGTAGRRDTGDGLELGEQRVARVESFMRWLASDSR